MSASSRHRENTKHPAPHHHAASAPNTPSCDSISATFRCHSLTHHHNRHPSIPHKQPQRLPRSALTAQPSPFSVSSHRLTGNVQYRQAPLQPQALLTPHHRPLSLSQLRQPPNPQTSQNTPTTTLLRHQVPLNPSRPSTLTAPSAFQSRLTAALLTTRNYGTRPPKTASPPAFGVKSREKPSSRK